MRETFQLLDDPECDKLGRQTWVLITIIMTELLICIKFGWATITKPLPRHIAMWWVLGATLLIVYTFVKEKPLILAIFFMFIINSIVALCLKIIKISARVLLVLVLLAEARSCSQT